MNTGEFVPLQDGRTLPIKFRIEQYALCSVPGIGPCASESVNLAVGGEVAIEDGGVEIPPQPGGTTTITVATCTDIPSDLPHHGSCIRVTADPPLSGPLTLPATVWVCHAPSGELADWEKRITLHRYDAPNTQALPHADDNCAPHRRGFGWSVRGCSPISCAGA